MHQPYPTEAKRQGEQAAKDKVRSSLQLIVVQSRESTAKHWSPEVNTQRKNLGWINYVARIINWMSWDSCVSVECKTIPRVDVCSERLHFRFFGTFIKEWQDAIVPPSWTTTVTKTVAPHHCTRLDFGHGTTRLAILWSSFLERTREEHIHIHIMSVT